MNKPVAWITMSGLSYQQTGLNDRPLYTHPVKENYMNEVLNNTLNMEKNHNEKAYKELYEVCVKQQAEIEALKAKLQLHEAMDNQCASLMQQFRKAQER